MSDREKAMSIIDSIPESQLGYIVDMLSSFRAAIEEAEDDAFCERLYNGYLNDEDSDKDNAVSIEEFAESIGVTL